MMIPVNRITRFLLYAPVAIAKAIVKSMWNQYRDQENKRRFKTSVIDSGCCIDSSSEIGENSHILSHCIINGSKIGNYSYISQRSLIQNTTIGNYCCISHEVICGLGRHPLEMFSVSPLFYRNKNTFGLQIVEDRTDFHDYLPIEIGNDIWIGARAIILDGVIIGDGAVIACGSVVTKDVPPYAIVAGVPAKVIKFRASDVLAEQWIQSEWWKLNPQEAYLKMNL